FCHMNTATCWGDATGLAGLESRLRAALAGGDKNSYTARLARDPALLRSKLVEEAAELADARASAHIAEEAADLLYFALARLSSAAGEGVPISAVESVLDRRALKLSRRSGDAKPAVPPTSSQEQ